MKRLGGLVVVVLLLTACGGGGGSAGSTAAGGVAPAKPKPTPENALGQTSAGIINRLGCTGARPYAATSDTVDVQLGPEAISETLCTFNGKTIKIYTYKTQAQVDAEIVLGKGFVTTGDSLDLATGPGWAVSAEDGSGNTQPGAQTILAPVATKLGGSLIHYVAP